MSRDLFGSMPDGRDVERVVLRGGGLTAHILTYGAVVQDLRLDGQDTPLVLGFESLEPYLTDSPYFGAMAGRYANRIRDGHLEIDGESYQLDRNFLSKHCLHGGSDGLANQIWTIETLEPHSVSMHCHLPDGHMGFPGALDVLVSYALLDDGVLDIHIEASTDKATVCNIAHHSYFNLDGADTIEDHILQIPSEDYLLLNEDLIPTGELVPVEGTPFDFRQPRRIGDVVKQKQIDANFCLSGASQPIRFVARLESPASGVGMDVFSTEPAVQAYDGAYMDIDKAGLDGQKLGPRAGFCLEPQIWPDAPHHAHFPQALLRPGETYRQQTQYVFSKR